MAYLNCKKLYVLVTDDSEEDSFFIERALRQSAKFQVIASVRNGAEAIAYLSAHGQYSDRQLWPLPDILLMHIKKRPADCFEVLEWLRGKQFFSLKVAVLFGSSAASKIQSLGALCSSMFHDGTAHNEQLKELVSDLEKLLTACGPNGELTLNAFQKND